MPDTKRNHKMTGDSHPPEIESYNPEAAPGERGPQALGGRSDRPGEAEGKDAANSETAGRKWPSPASIDAWKLSPRAQRRGSRPAPGAWLIE